MEIIQLVCQEIKIQSHFRKIFIEYKYRYVLMVIDMNIECKYRYLYSINIDIQNLHEK